MSLYLLRQSNNSNPIATILMSTYPNSLVNMKNEKKLKYYIDLLKGMELCRNAFAFFNKTYIVDMSNKVINASTMREKITLCNELISVFVTLEAEYDYMYSNNTTITNEGDLFKSNTKYIFREKSNPCYSRLVFVQGKGNDFYKLMYEHDKKNPKLGFKLRVDNIFAFIQDDFKASKDTMKYFLDRCMKTYTNIILTFKREFINESRSLFTYQNKNMENHGNLSDYRSDTINSLFTRDKFLNLLKHKWKISNEDATFESHVNDKSTWKPNRVYKDSSTTSDIKDGGKIKDQSEVIKVSNDNIDVSNENIDASNGNIMINQEPPEPKANIVENREPIAATSKCRIDDMEDDNDQSFISGGHDNDISLEVG